MYGAACWLGVSIAVVYSVIGLIRNDQTLETILLVYFSAVVVVVVGRLARYVLAKRHP